jgi:hypothetical protein
VVEMREREKEGERERKKEKVDGGRRERIRNLITSHFFLCFFLRFLDFFFWFILHVIIWQQIQV